MNKERRYANREQDLKHGKKKFRERLIQDKEAKEDIIDFLEHPEKEYDEDRPTVRNFD